MAFHKCSNDNSFGPGVQGCRDNFDFTLRFGHVFFSLLPSAVFLILAIANVAHLYCQRILIAGETFQRLKLVASLVYVSTQLSLLILLCKQDVYTDSLAVAAAALALVVTPFICVISYLEHSRSLRPSILLNLYLCLTILFDAVQSRTLLIGASERSSTRTFMAAIGVKIILLFLEAQGERRWIISIDRSMSPEETCGPISISTFYWLNKLLIKGTRKMLLMEDLYPLDQALSTSVVAGDGWNQQAVHGQLGKWNLLYIMLKVLKLSFFAPVPFRIGVIGFSFCQPFLINRITKYLGTPANSTQANIGYGLIGATAISYLGLTITKAPYAYFNWRYVIKARGYLVARIFKRMTELRSSAAHDSSLTLMSSDVERIRAGLMSIHDLWASFCLLLFGVTLILGRYAGRRQSTWQEKLQKRVGSTAHIIAHLKAMKMSELAEQLSSSVLDMREIELDASRGWGMIAIFCAIVALAPSMLAPVFTFASTNKSLDTSKIFTSLSYLILLTTPLQSLFQVIPVMVSGPACLERIAKFLSLESQTDFRKFISDGNHPSKDLKHHSHYQRSVVIKNGQFGWSEDKPVLADINIIVASSQFLIVIGTVGSGKSTLCNAILGEVPFAQGETILFQQNIGLCSQTPFLPNDTVRNIVVGFFDFDRGWYDEILDATALQQDIQSWDEGDQTMVGTKGASLSGGQRHRVAIARALYSRAKFLIFDDPFSGLDRATEDQIVEQLFSIKGLLRRQQVTVVLSTHALRHLPMAETIIVLNEAGRIAEVGTYEDLVAQGNLATLLPEASGFHRTRTEGMTGSERSIDNRPPKSQKREAEVTDKARQRGDLAIYHHYFTTIGLVYAVPFVILGVALGFLWTFPPIWLKFWADSNTYRSRNGYYIGIYGTLSATGLFTVTLFIWLNMITMAMRSGRLFHQRVLSTPMAASLFFHTDVDVGVTINRFPQDLSVTDTELSAALSNTAVTSMVSVGQAVVIATASPYIAAGYPVLILVMYFIQKMYLKTSRQMRYMDLEAKSPLYTHFIETIAGIVTIRAFRSQNRHVAQNHALLDNSQRPFYLLAMIQQWLMMVLNFVVAAVATILVALATQLRANSGFTGVGLISLMTFSEMLTSIILNWTQLETSISAVSRLKSFSKTVKDENREEEVVRPREWWPETGRIEIEGVSAAYGNAEDDHVINFALRDITLSISAGEKLALVGRTGSEKSSLLLLLMRFLDPLPPTCQRMVIDDIPLHIIHRGTLRSRLIAMPQDPFFLPDGSTFMANLDPYDKASVEECTDVLQEVGLIELINERGGLSEAMNPGSISEGQKQLFSVGRAVLRARQRAKLSIQGEKGGKGGKVQNGGILLLDEITSSVDKQTDELIQKIIRMEFDRYTIIAVAHRIETVLDFDRVAVMEEGRIKEIGEPRIMLGRKNDRG
ncbi:ABC transporter [Tothia fuscella]|uniref:ABC transporter n=1 Tax=Tothia fuscella TaxID=1048955 RepID=A0A9P4TY15_9PEZI|nr:ABC transporter [Tothia fuscella]